MTDTDPLVRAEPLAQRCDDAARTFREAGMVDKAGEQDAYARTVRDLRAEVVTWREAYVVDLGAAQFHAQQAAADLAAQTAALRELAEKWREIVARCDREDTGNPLALSRLMQCAAEVDALSARPARKDADG